MTSTHYRHVIPHVTLQQRFRSAAQSAGDLDKNLVADCEGRSAVLADQRFKALLRSSHIVGEFKALDATLSQFMTRRRLLLEARA